MLIRIAGWSVLGFAVGTLMGVFGMVRGDWGIGTVLLTGTVAWAVSFFGPLAILSAAGRVMGSIYHPSGSSTPRKRGYSQAESFVARGDFEGGIAAFELAIEEDAADPTPYLRIARIHRDRLGRYEDSAGWFKRALSDATIEAGVAALVHRELLELYEARMGVPERAAPMLARVAEEESGSPEGVWASRELARIKARMADGRGD